jgi:voltage-gated potassium channel
MKALFSFLSRWRAAIWAPIEQTFSLILGIVWEVWELFVRNPAFRLVFGLMIGIAVLGAVVVTILDRTAPDRQITTIADAVWWAFVTMTTTGYGDITPKTHTARFVAVLMMFAGIALMSFFTATVASIFVTQRLKEAQGLERIRWQHHTLICGWNKDVEQLITGLLRAGRNRIVLVNDLNEEQMQPTLYKYGESVKFVRGNYCLESVLDRANVREAEAAIVMADVVGGTTANADERTIIATLAIKTMEPGVMTCAELLNRDNEQHLLRADVDDIVVSGEDSGLLLASAIVARGVPQVVRELLSFDIGNSLYRVSIPKQFVGRTFRELADHFRTAHRAILIALVSEEASIGVGDILGGEASSAIDDFIRQKFAEAEKSMFGENKQKVATIVNPGDDHEILPEHEAIVIASAPITS